MDYLFNLDRYSSRYGVLTIILGCISGTIILIYLTINNSFDVTWTLISTISLITIISIYLIGHILSKWHRFSSQNIDDISYSCRYNRTLTRCFFDIPFTILYSITLIIIQTTQERQIIYHVSITLLFLFVVLSIFFGHKNSEKIYILKHTFQTILISLLIFLALFKYYYWVGYDTWIHALFNHSISIFGNFNSVSIPRVGKEEFFPLSHIIVSITEIISDINIRDATIFAISVPNVLVSLILVPIFRKVIDLKCVLLILLLINTQAFVIYFRMMGVTSTHAFSIFIILLVLLLGTIFINMDNYTLSIKLSLIATLLICIAITHLFIAIVVLLLCFSMVISLYIVRNKIRYHILTVFTLYWAFICIYLSWVEWGLWNILILIKNTLNSNSILSQVVTTENIIDPYMYVGTPTAIELLLRMLPMSIAIVAPILITLLYIFTVTTNNDYIEYHKNLLVIIMAFILCFIIGISCGVIYPLMSGRIVLLLTIFLSIGFGFLVHYYLNGVAHTKLSYTLLVSIIIIFIISILFINISHPSLNDENPLWSNNTHVSESTTPEEVTALETIITYIPLMDSNSIGMDRATVFAADYYYGIVKQNSELPKAAQIANWLNLSEKTTDYVLFSERLLHTTTKSQIQYGPTENEYVDIYYKLDYKLFGELESNCRAYDSGGSQMYYMY